MYGRLVDSLNPLTPMYSRLVEREDLIIFFVSCTGSSEVFCQLIGAHGKVCFWHNKRLKMYIRLRIIIIISELP